MNYLWIIPRVLWKCWFGANFVITLILLYPVFFILLSNEKWFIYAFRLMRAWAKWLCYSSGIFPSVRFDTDKALLPSPCIYVSNHCSYLDIIMSYVTLPNFFVFVGKQELDKAPLFRIFFKRMNILVNRKSTVESHRAYLQAAERIEKGQSIFIFPEATISANGKLIPFKNGAFKLAIDKQVPIIPLAFPDNWKLFQNGGFLKSNGRPGIARAIVHNPIYTRGLTHSDLIPLRDKVKHIIRDILDKNP